MLGEYAENVTADQTVHDYFLVGGASDYALLGHFDLDDVGDFVGVQFDGFLEYQLFSILQFKPIEP